MTKFLGNIIRWWAVLVWIGLTITFAWMKANADTTGKRTLDKTPVIYHNPRMYQLGTVLEITLIHPERGKTWTVVRWKPIYAPLLYDESLNFCGNVADKFAGVRVDEEIILIYSRAIEVARDSGPSKTIISCRSLDFVRKLYKENAR